MPSRRWHGVRRVVQSALALVSASALIGTVFAQTVPTAPTISGVEGMNGALAVRVSPPSSNGGAAITSYSVTCGAQSASGLVSPFIVSGLSNGTAVSCTARATNSVGQGPASVAVQGTPFQPLIYTIAGTGTSGYGGDGGQANVAQVNQPTAVISDTSGNLYVADLVNHRVRKISPDGVISTVAGTGTAGYSGDGGSATAAQINGPHGLALDANGNLYIACFGDHRVRKVTAAGIISTIAGTGVAGIGGDGSNLAVTEKLNQPVSVTVDPNRKIFISERGNNRVRYIDTGGYLNTFVGTGSTAFNGDGIQSTSANLNSPGAIRYSGGYIYIADMGNHRVRRADINNNVITTVAGTGTAGFSGDGGQATSANFNTPYGIAFHPNGDLYVGSAGDNRIRKITPAGIVTTVAGDGTTTAGANGSVALSGGVSPNMDVLIDSVGNLYFAGYMTSTIRKVSLVLPVPPTGVTATAALNSLSVSFMPAPTNGGIPVTGFAVTCGSQSNTGTSSPIVVSGLTGGTAVTCAVQAVSASGRGAASVASSAVAPLIAQTIMFTTLPAVGNRIVNGADSVAATGGASGNPVVFTSATPGICTTGGTNGSSLSFVGAGSCTINANQAAGAGYAAATQASTTFAIAQATQTITNVFETSPSNRVFGASGAFTATGGASGNAVTYSNATPAICTVASSGANTAIVSYVGTGLCMVNLNQAGNTNYSAAPVYVLSLSIGKADQTITLGAMPFALVGVGSTMSATATSSLTVSFSSLTPSVCTTSGTNGTTITASQLGVCTIAADQAGNANYNAAPQVTRTLGVYQPATYTAATGLLAARVRHTATKLNDGRILVVGGYAGAPLPNVEIYDPTANTWTPVGGLGTARQLHSATLLNNGKVLIAGGRGNSATLGNAELFDPATNTFSAAGSGQARDGHQAILLADGRVMVIGGSFGNGCCQSNTADIYDPNANTWTATANLPVARSSYSAARLPNGTVLVAGGNTGSTTATSIIYDPATNAWGTAGSLANARFLSPGATLANGQFLVAGGYTSVVTATAERYDSATNTWSSAGNLVVPRSNHPVVMLASGMALAIGGENSGGTTNTSDFYNPVTNAWSPTATLATARHLHTATTLNDGRVLVASGATSGLNYTNTAEIYSPVRFAVLPSNATLANGQGGTAYASVTFTGQGGLPAYTYSVANGTLPTGLTLSASGVLSGTPTAAGAFSFSVVATDANGQAGTRQYNLTIAATAQSITFGAAPTINMRTTGTATVSATGGGSGNPVVFTSTTPSICTVSGTNGSTVTGVTTGTCVIAANQAGNAGYTVAPQVTQSIEVRNVPGAPTIGVATRGNASVTVSFTPPASNGNSNITLYFVFCTGAGSVGSTFGSASPVVVNSLTNGIPVTCVVSAINAIGEGLESSASNAVTPATVPDAPIIGTATTGGSGIVNVAFTAPAPNGSAITAYLANCGGITQSGTSSPIAVSGLINGIAVTCNVIAGNDVGDSPVSQDSNSVTPVGPPTSPTNVTAVAGNGSISVNLTPPTNTGGTPITSYTATCRTVNYSHQVSGTSASLPVVVTGVTNGVSLVCSVIATNAQGNSNPSFPSNAVVGAGIWRAAASMGNARTSHTVTVLADGRVLVAGGADSMSNIPAAAEIYNPSTNSWSATGSLNTPRIDHTATLMNDGRVLVAGGKPNAALNQWLTSTEIYDPATGLWTVGPNMTYARQYHNAILLGNGKVLLAGGTFSQADLFDPTNNNMSSGGTDPVSRYDAITVMMSNGRVLTAGGMTGATATAIASLYNPATNTWTATTSMANARSKPGAVLMSNGSALVVAGSPDSNPTQIAQAEAYNINLGSWTPAANVPAPVYSDATLSVLPTGSVLRVGGRDGSPTSVTMGYNLSMNAWVQSSSLLGVRSAHRAAVLSNGQLLVVGGANTSGAIATAEIRDADGATAPNAPAIGTATPANTSVSVAFTPTPFANNGGSAITGYTATCGAQSNSGTSSPIVVSGLPNNVAVTCTVAATNAFGTGAPSAASNSVTPIGVPGSPTIGTATTSAGNVTVNFTAPTNDGGSAITGYSATCGTTSLSGSDSPIVFTNLTPGVAVTCTVRASNSFGLGAASAASNSVTPIGSQTITFGSTPIIGISNSATLSATGGASGQPVIFSSATTSVCTVSGTNGSTVTGVTQGTCTINANQAGNASYSAAQQVSLSFSVGMGTQTITFGPAPTIGNGQSATIMATGGASGNPVTFASTTPGVCTMSGSTVTAGYAGICTITANQAGNASYQAATASLSFSLVSESWAVTGTMQVARNGHTLTRLNDGRVLAVGGANATSAALSSAELYNPSTGTWSAAANLTAARYGHTATLLGDGTVLVISGLDANGFAINSVTRYNPATDTWSAATSIPESRAQHTATLLTNGKIFVAAGITEVEHLSTTLLYDPTANTWSAGPNTPFSTPLSGHTAHRLANGNVLLVAGQANYSPSCQTLLYNASGNTISAAPNFSATDCRDAHTSTLLGDNRVLLVGGGDYDYYGNVWTSTFAYTPGTNTWQARANMATARQSHTANLLSSGKVLVAGGSDAAIADVATAMVYNPLTDTWATTASLVAPRTKAQSVLLNDGRVMVAGGLANGVQLATAELYDDGTALPGAPAIGTATAGDASATVTFTVPSGQGVTSVTATSAPGGISATCNMPCSSIVVNGLTNGTAYTFTVTATNYNGTSFASAASNSVTPAPSLLPQSINFGSPPTITVGGTGTVSATGGASGNAVTFTSQTTSICTVSGTNGEAVAGVALGTCIIAANQAGSASYAAAPQVTLSFSITAPASFTVTPSAGANGSISPATAQTVNGGTTASFNVTPNAGYVADVTGTCGGSLAGNTFTTNAVVANCTVEVSFRLLVALSSAASRKTHGSAGTFEIAINPATPIGGAINVDPRTIGSGHTIVFSYNQAIASVGMVTATDAGGSPIGSASAVVNPGNANEVLVTLTGIPDVSRVLVSVAGVAGAIAGTTTSSAAMGFLVGDVNQSRSVNATDVSSVKSAVGQATDATNFRFDVNASGTINATDLSAVKTRTGGAI